MKQLQCHDEEQEVQSRTDLRCDFGKLLVISGPQGQCLGLRDSVLASGTVEITNPNGVLCRWSPHFIFRWELPCFMCRHTPLVIHLLPTLVWWFIFCREITFLVRARGHTGRVRHWPFPCWSPAWSFWWWPQTRGFLPAKLAPSPAPYTDSIKGFVWLVTKRVAFIIAFLTSITGANACVVHYCRWYTDVHYCSFGGRGNCGLGFDWLMELR